MNLDSLKIWVILIICFLQIMINTITYICGYKDGKDTSCAYFVLAIFINFISILCFDHVLYYIRGVN